MANITNPEAVKFSNEEARPYNDHKLANYRTAKQLIANYTGKGMSAILGATGTDVIVDGAATDGRTARFRLEPMSVASFHGRTLDLIRTLGGTPELNGRPNEIPEAIPFAKDRVERPYDAAASEVGMTTEELLAHLGGMVERKLLRRVAAILFHRRAGFSANGMGVWKVPDEQIMEVGARMASYRGVSHCYQRPTYDDWPYSVFTMVHGRTARDCEATIDAIRMETGVDEYCLLWSVKEYKKVRLEYFTPEWDGWYAKHATHA